MGSVKLCGESPTGSVKKFNKKGLVIFMAAVAVGTSVSVVALVAVATVATAAKRLQFNLEIDAL